MENNARQENASHGLSLRMTGEGFSMRNEGLIMTIEPTLIRQNDIERGLAPIRFEYPC